MNCYLRWSTIAIAFTSLFLHGNRVDADNGGSGLSQRSDPEAQQQIDTAAESRRLGDLARLAKAVRLDFRNDEPLRYGQLTLKICSNLTTFDFGDARQYGMASQLTLDALEVADKFPIEMELALVTHLQGAVDAEGPVSGMSWGAIRRKQAAAWLHALQRLDKLLKEKWDPSSQPCADAIIPGFEDLAAGADPSVIADPKRRQRYIDALSAEKAHSDRFREHVKANEWMHRYDPLFEKYMVAIYQTSPPAENELRGLLAASTISSEAQSRILSAVVDKRPKEPK